MSTSPSSSPAFEAAAGRGGPSLLLTAGAGGTLHLREEDDAIHWTFDAGGRLFAGREGSRSYQVALDGGVRIREGDRERGFGASERWDAQAAAPLFARAREHAARGLAALERGAAILPPSGAGPIDPLAARAALSAAARRDPAAYLDDQAAFARVYRPVRMLPPDSYLALLVQLTEGCSWGRCSFCSLYREVPFRAKDQVALVEHLDGIAGVLGAGLALRRGVFLGDANACLLPQPRLLRAMQVIRARFPAQAEAGMQSFIDAFTPPGKLPQELSELREAGLQRVTLGLESGHAPLVARLGKPGSPADALALTGRLHDAGIHVSVTVLVGAGGPEAEALHIRDTAAILRDMQLRPRDRVYLSPLLPSPLSSAALDQQALRLREALAGLTAQVALYDLERWIY